MTTKTPIQMTPAEVRERVERTQAHISEALDNTDWNGLEWLGDDISALARLARGVGCPRCSGRGHYTYSSTSTWRGGIAGQAMTEGVCDACWGTGRTDTIGVDLRKVRG